MRPTPKRRTRWRSPHDDGIAHAFHNSRGAALCGAYNLPERWDRRPTARCTTCEAMEEERVRRDEQNAHADRMTTRGT